VKKILSLAIIAVFIGGIWYYDHNRQSVIKLDLPPARDYQVFVSDRLIANNDQASSAPTKINLDYLAPTAIPRNQAPVSPGSINLDVPFSSQAPTADWSQPWQDACEEASLLMVDYYYQNKDLPAQEDVEKIILGLVKWQEDNWGGHHNLPLAQVAKLAELNYSYRAEIVSDLTADKIKKYLDQGLPVIVPADGHQLDNPFFSNDGPDYHMLVIKGYRGDNFITNDPGTKRGADFVYTAQNLLESIHDWDEQKSQALGPRVALVLHKN